MSKNKEQKKNKNNNMLKACNEKTLNPSMNPQNKEEKSEYPKNETEEAPKDRSKDIKKDDESNGIEVSLDRNNSSDNNEVSAEQVEGNVYALSFWEKIGCALAKKYVGSLKQQIEEIKSEYQKKQSEYETEHDKLTGKIAELKNKTDKDEKNFSNISKRNEELDTEKKRLETENKGLNAEIIELKNKNQSLTDKIEQLESTNKNLKDNEHNKERLLKEADDRSNRILDIMKSKFKDIITETMTINEAITELANALITYKEQIESANNNAKKAEVKNNEMEMKLQNAEHRVKEIESSDNGKLTLELENTKHDLKENISLLAQKVREFEDFKEKDYCNLKKEKEVAEEKIKESQKQLEDEKNAYNESITNLNNENERLKEEHKASIIKLKEEHKKALLDKDNKHSNEIDKIKQDNTDKFKQTEEKHTKEIASIKETAANKENELNIQLKTKDNEITVLKATLQNESDCLRNRSIDIITRLYEFLKGNEIMAACSDDYRDKVEEKLQDLIFNSKEMMNDINQLPQAKTPSEWGTTLKSYIIDKIEENTSLINILLKYYILSSVPFMIDSKRDNGLYFIRKNIKYAYDAIVTILKQCNITPILPTLFVENINEGAYEVEGQFNDIESFCPGSINEHIEYVERSSEGLEGIIIGVTRVGYLIGDEKQIKAQVLIS